MKFKTFFIFLMISLLPSIVMGKMVTCSNDGNTATIEIDKDKIGINQTATIKVSSETPYEIEYKSNPKDIVVIGMDGEIKGINEGNTSINIELEFKDSETSTSTCKIDLPIEVVSNDSSLKLLKISEYNLDDVFKSNKYDYNITVPYSIDKINIEGEANSSSATINGIGKKYLSEGVDTFDIVVTASDGSTSTYSISISKEEPSKDGTLKNLIIEGYVLTPAFSKDIFEYNLSVDKSVHSIIINGIPNDENAKVDGNGEFNLASGDNRYIVSVTAEDNSLTKYEIKVNKNNGSGKLKKLEIENMELNPKFNSDTYIYELTVNNNIDKLNINASAIDDDQIEIIGNEKFQDGKNDIIIRITNKDKSSTTYKIVINKLSELEEKKIEKNKSLLRVLLIILIISLIVMFLLIGMFIKNNFGKKKKVIMNKKMGKKK